MSIRGVTAYSLVQATVRALYSMMLTSETWGALLHAQDCNAVFDALSSTVYGPHLEIEPALMTPRRAVYQIRWHLADAFQKLIRLTPERGRPLLVQLWRLYEVDNLKATLRGIETGASWDQVLHLLSPMTQDITLTTTDMEGMIRAGDMAGAIERTQHTPYYDTLVHALERYRAEKNLFPLEVALDLDYYRGLWQSINQLTGQDHEQAMRIVGTLIDVNNLLWALRYRIYHHLSLQEIINYTLPVGYRVRDEDIRAIAAGDDGIGVVSRIYPELVEHQQPSSSGAGLTDLELALHRHVIRLCRATFYGDPFHVGVPVAYLLLTEYEIGDLTVLIEAKDSGLPTKAFAPILALWPTAQRAD